MEQLTNHYMKIKTKQHKQIRNDGKQAKHKTHVFKRMEKVTKRTYKTFCTLLRHLDII